jgi:hypothetical protein
MQFLLIPTARVTGIASPALLRPEAPDRRWRAVSSDGHGGTTVRRFALSRPAKRRCGIVLDGGYKGARRELANPPMAVSAGIHSQL